MDGSPTPTTSPRRRRPRFASALVVLIGLFSAACIIWFVVQRLAPWSDFNLFGFVLAPWLLLGLLISLIVVLILSARSRRFTGVIPVVLALALLSPPYVAARLPRPTLPNTNGTPLRVMSFNVWLSTAGTNLDQIA